MSKQIRVFWMGFVFTAALTVWVYWMWRHRRVVAPRPLVVSQSRPSRDPRPSAKVEELPVAPDALEEINGIGPVYANRLNDAGIFTFAQLASTSSEDILQITGAMRWDPADWKEEAAKLSKAQ